MNEEKRGTRGTGSAFAALIVVFFFWGSVYVSNGYILRVLTPLELACCRFLVAGAGLWTLVFIKKEKMTVRKEDWKYIILIAFLGYYLSMDSVLVSVRYAGASLGSLVNSLNPMTISLAAAILLKEKLTLRRMVCLALGLVGVGIVSGGFSAQGDIIRGVLWGLAALLTWAVSASVTRMISHRLSALTITTLAVSVSLVFHIPTLAVELAHTGLPQVQPSLLFFILYSGICGTAVPQVLWSFALSRLPASTCSMFYPLMPVFSALLGVVLLGEHLNGRFYLGGILIVSTVIISCLGGHEKKEGRV